MINLVMQLSKVLEEVDKVLGGFDASSFSDIFEDFFGDFGESGSSRRSSNRGNDLRI